ncbi:hypothetical protein HispidOSU_006840, partial [Sigmodon hispidus]
MEQKDKVDVPCLSSSLGINTGAPLGLEPGHREPEIQGRGGYSSDIRIQDRTMEPKDKVDVPCLPSILECNTGINTGAPLGIEPSPRGPANPRGRGYSFGIRTQD